MHPITPLIPRQPVPPLEVPLAGGGVWRLADEQPRLFTMVVFYRGRHCSICSRYLADLEAKLPEFEKRGVSVIAISADSEERANAAREAWKLGRLRIGYGLDFDVARRWGLYLSAGKFVTRQGVSEPPVFIEPALYLIHPGGRLYYGSVQTMPFGRPAFDDVLHAIDFGVQRNFPARGDVLDHRTVAAAEGSEILHKQA